MRPISDEQRRVLKMLKRQERRTPKECRCRVSTFVALAKRRLIYVPTSFASIGWPRTAARAELTDAGRAALRSK